MINMDITSGKIDLFRRRILRRTTVGAVDTIRPRIEVTLQYHNENRH